MDRLTIRAKIENLEQVLRFVDERLEAAGCSMKTQMQVDIAVEELFVNIASYAYAPDEGDAEILAGIAEDGKSFEITFIDYGVPYDPLEKQDPDLTLPASERPIGGLGIFMAKKSMDRMTYEYRDGRNILTIRKDLQ